MTRSNPSALQHEGELKQGASVGSSNSPENCRFRVLAAVTILPSKARRSTNGRPPPIRLSICTDVRPRSIGVVSSGPASCAVSKARRFLFKVRLGPVMKADEEASKL